MLYLRVAYSDEYAIMKSNKLVIFQINYPPKEDYFMKNDGNENESDATIRQIRGLPEADVPLREIKERRLSVLSLEAMQILARYNKGVAERSEAVLSRLRRNQDMGKFFLHHFGAGGPHPENCFGDMS